MKKADEDVSAVRNAFIFFVAHISERKEIQIPNHLYASVIKDLLTFH